MWRDKIQPGVPVFVAWVVPTPPPLPLSRSSGHLIVYQHPHPQFVPFLVSIHFIALRVEGFSHAIAVLDRNSMPLRIVDKLNMGRVCSGPPGATWTDSICIAENLLLSVPSPGDSSHPATMTNPAGVASAQTAPVQLRMDALLFCRFGIHLVMFGKMLCRVMLQMRMKL